MSLAFGLGLTATLILSALAAADLDVVRVISVIVRVISAYFDNEDPYPVPSIFSLHATTPPNAMLRSPCK